MFDYPRVFTCSWLGTNPLQWVIQKYQWAYHPWKYLNEVMHHPEWVQNLEKKHEWFDGRRQPIHQCSETQVYTWRDYRVSMSFNFHHLGMPTASQTEVTAQKLLRVCPCDWELEAIIGQKATAPNCWCKRMDTSELNMFGTCFFFATLATSPMVEASCQIPLSRQRFVWVI